MQKQKTIAKWLAVILLVTIAIACYIALDAIMPKESDNIQNIAGADNASPTPTPIPPAIYSTFPRKCESVNNLKVAHVGGEQEDAVIDTIYCFEKNLIIFKSSSTQYDVRECGIYIAVFDCNTLEKTIKICDVFNEYLCSVQTKKGLLIAVKNSQNTDLFLFDENLNVVCENTLSDQTILSLCQTQHETTAFVYSENKLRAISIDNSLNVTGNNFVLKKENLSIFKTIILQDKILLFCNIKDGLLLANYSHNNGFTVCFCDDKTTIVQVMPTLVNNKQTFLLLQKCGDDFCVQSFSSDLELQAKYDIENVKNAVLFQGKNGIEIVADDSIIALCSHLDFISKAQIDYDTNMSKEQLQLVKNADKYTTFDGENALILARKDHENLLLERSGNSLKLLLSFSSGDDIFCSAICDNKGKNKTIQLAFDCTVDNAFSYMCFAKNDVFFISLLTSEND